MGLVQQAVERNGSGILTNASCEYVTENSFAPKEGGAEETYAEELTAIGLLEFVPKHRPDSWFLRVRVEYELGNRLPVLRS